MEKKMVCKPPPSTADLSFLRLLFLRMEVKSSPQMFTSSVVENEKKFSGEVGLSGSGDRSVGDRGESSRCSPGLRGCGDNSFSSVCVCACECVCVCVCECVCVHHKLERMHKLT